MDSKQELKKVLAEMTDGDLKKAMSYMNSENFNNKTFINIIVTLCHLLSKSPIMDKISISEIKDVIVLCCTKIKCPTESEINNYLRSLYHLLKFLTDKLAPSDLIEVCECIFPEWISSEKPTGDLHDLIMHFNILLHNEVIIPISRSEDTSSLIKVLWLHLRLQKYVFSRQPKSLFTKIQSYCSIVYKNAPFDIFPTFCSDIYQLLADINNLTDKESVKEAYHTFLSIIFIYFMNSSNIFSVNRNYIEKTFDMLQKSCMNFDAEHDLCVETFKLFYYLTVKDVNRYTKNDLIIFNQIRENFETLLKIYSLSPSVITTFNYISKILRILVDKFEKTDKDVWNMYMLPEIQIEYMKIFQFVGRVLSKTEYTDNCLNCLIKHDITHGFNITNISGTFLNLSLRYESPKLDDIQEAAFISLKDCCKYIEKLKAGNCERWISNWRMMGTMLYNIGSRFYRINNYKLSKMYYCFLSKYIILFEGTENLVLENTLGTALHLIGSCYLNMKQYRSALTYLSYGIQVCPNMHGKIWQTWCNVKAKANSDNVGNIAELTIKHVLEKDLDMIKLINPSYVYHSEAVENLLFLELQYYSKIWASKIPMNNACKELFKVCNDPITRTIALSLTWEKVVSLQDQEFIDNLEKTIILLNKKDKRNALKTQLCLSVVHYIDFQCKSYEILKKNLSEMNDNVIEKKTVFKPYEEPPNPNDTCDIVPAFYNNNIENNMQLHKILNKSVELWNKILESDELETVKELAEELKVDNLIKQTAYEYRLQNYSLQMLKTWFLYLQYGKLFHKKEIIVMSVGFILEIIDCESDTAKNLQKSAEVYLNEFISDGIFWATIVTYYINKSTGYMKCNMLKEGFQELSSAEKYITSITDDSSKILEARILYLKSLYLQKPCNIKLTQHTQNFIVLSQNAFTTIAEFYKTGGNKCHYTLSVLFDISLSIGWLYKWLRMPREIRCYSSESVILAQQMVLPLRTAQFFSLLAFTDLLGCQLDDCKVKISGIDYILCYSNSSKFNKTTIENIECVSEISKDFEKMSLTRDNIFETMLDVPVDHRIKNLQGSPILQSKPFRLPVFMYHLDCNCFYCLNIDYQRVILECTHLEAVFYMRQNNIQCAANFFKGGLNLYTGILRKYNSLSNTLTPELMAQFKKKLTFTYVNFLMDYSFYYSKKKEHEEAEKIIDMIFDILGDEIYTNAYFYDEAVLQKISLLTIKQYKNAEPIQNESKNELSIDYDLVLSKTPESKMSVAKCSPALSPYDEPTPKKNIKKYTFTDIFGSDDDKDEQYIPETKNKIFKFKTPGKTPAPNVSKIKIYTPAPNKKNKVQPMCLAVSPNPEHIPPKKIEITKSPVNLETKLRSRQILEKRTKILTEKLKSESNKTVLKELNNIQFVQPEKKSYAQKENIFSTRKLRKNLMEDLCNEDKLRQNLGNEKSNKEVDLCDNELNEERVNKETNSSAVQDDNQREISLKEPEKDALIDKELQPSKNLRTRVSKLSLEKPEKTCKKSQKNSAEKLLEEVKDELIDTEIKSTNNYKVQGRIQRSKQAIKGPEEKSKELINKKMITTKNPKGKSQEIHKVPLKESKVIKNELIDTETKPMTSRTRIEGSKLREPKVGVKPAVKRQYKRIVDHASTSSEETIERRSTRSVSKM